jgi:biopolymer transport protein ExbB/TolQ
MMTELFLRLTHVGAEWVLWILVALSVISIALIVERWLYFLRSRSDVDELPVKLHEQLRAHNLQGAWQLVKDSQTYCIESGVVAAGLASLRNGPQAVSEAMQSVKARMRPQLDANLATLATIGSNAPFIGLLGTVLGIIKAANELTTGDAAGNSVAVMSGVFEALVATAVGLFVAIPAVIAYNLFLRRVRKRMAEVDSLAHMLLSTLRYETPAAAAPTASTPTRVA